MNDDMILRSPQEQEVFQRVWQRVMAGRNEGNSPIVPAPTPAPDPGPMPLPTPALPRRWVDGDMSCDYLEALSRAMPAHPLPGDLSSGDLPTAGLEYLPHGESTARLRQQTLEALEAWQFYRHLARRTRGNTARMLTALAADQHRLARKLATAYFLRSGVRYWPTEQLPAPAIPSFWGALRQRHQGEQQAELSYRMAADEADDSTLTELYEELMESCRGHCRQLRALLEQSCP